MPAAAVPAFPRFALISDDWGWRADRGELGQKEAAFKAFMAANPSLRAAALPPYIPQARVFLLRRADG